MIFSTEYYLSGTRYTTVIYAANLSAAWICIRMRKMDETIIYEDLERPEYTSDLIVQHRWADAIHAACWLGMIGTNCGSVTGLDLLGDQGLIHTLSHLVRKQPEDFKNPSDNLQFLILLAYWNALKMEAKVPGFYREGEEDWMGNDKEVMRMYHTHRSVLKSRPEWIERNS